MRATCFASLLVLLIPMAVSASKAAPGGLDLKGMDRSVAPDQDFFRYANGTWLEKTVIPPDRGREGPGRQLQELTNQRIREQLKGKAAKGENADIGRARDYYASFMDEAGIEKLGVAPLKAELAQIAAIGNKEQLATYLGSTLRADVDVLNSTNYYTANPFGGWIAQDLTDTSKYTVFLLQGGLSLPDREYYLDESPRMAEIRKQFREHAARAFKLAGVSDGVLRADRVLELEHKLAVVHWPHEDTEQVAKGNNHWSASDFGSKAPGLNWKAYFAAAGLGEQKEFIAWQASAITGISKLIGDESIEAWKDVLALHAIDAMSPFLPTAFVDESFAFYSKVLSGIPQQQARWKRGINFTSGAVGDAVGRLYVGKYFPAKNKAQIQAMVRELLAAFVARIDALDWMSPKTKERAKAKVAALKIGIGYPDHWREYEGLKIVRGDAYGNERRAEAYRWHDELKKLGRKVDRDEWCMVPQLVNAVNLPAMNALNFPAAILQPPYFDPRNTAAVNYGAIGATIGHEISHSFDDQGAQFDEAGRLDNWWTNDDLAHFQAAGEKLAQQYSGYKPFPDLALNGRQVLSENIADLAGLAATYDAWRHSLGGKPAPLAQGFNGDQQFFISYAQSWRQKIRETSLRRQVLTDGHAPDEYRADTVRNLDAFYAAFETKPGRALYLSHEERVRVW